MLWLCVQLPDFPLEIRSRGVSAHEALAISEGEGREQRIIAANEHARRDGIRPGMRTSEAYALTHRLCVLGRDAAAEQDALARLAAWGGRYTSLVSLALPAALLLEVEGSRNIHGSLDRLIDHLQAGLDELGYTARLALAPTPLGALWLAQYGREVRIVEHAQLFSALADLPLACLGLDARQQTLLKELGLTTLIDCLRLPRDGIARRVGPQVLDMLDRAFGRRPDPRPAFVPPEHFRARLGLPAPVVAHEALLFPLRRLLHELAGFLLARGMGAATLQITLHASRRRATRVLLRLVAPSRDPQHLTSLVRERLERLMLAAPVEEITLEANALLPLTSQPGDFFAGHQTPGEMRAQMLERLQARLGRDVVQGLAIHPDHRPESAWHTVEPEIISEKPGNSLAAPDRAKEKERARSKTKSYSEGKEAVNRVAARRPLWLLPKPMPLSLCDGQPYWGGRLALEPGCERIESGWWNGAGVRRDYFIACHADGRRLWVFRELSTRQWFLHGLFG